MTTKNLFTAIGTLIVLVTFVSRDIIHESLAEKLKKFESAEQIVQDSKAEIAIYGQLADSQARQLSYVEPILLENSKERATLQANLETAERVKIIAFRCSQETASMMSAVNSMDLNDSGIKKILSGANKRCNEYINVYGPMLDEDGPFEWNDIHSRFFNVVQMKSGDYISINEKFKNIVTIGSELLMAVDLSREDFEKEVSEAQRRLSGWTEITNIISIILVVVGAIIGLVARLLDSEATELEAET